MADELTRLIREVSKVKDQVRGLLSADQIRHSSIENGTLLVNDANQKTVMKIGLQEDGTHAVVHVVGPPPPQPSPPIVTVDGVVITVEHDGTNVDGAPLPADYRRRIVYAGLVPDMSDAVPVATIEPPSGGQAIFMSPGNGTVYVAVKSETFSTALSVYSQAVPVEVTMVSLEGELEIIKDSTNGKNKNYYSPTKPETGSDGDVWFDTSIDHETGQPKWGLHLWDGSKWVSARDSRLQVVETAQAELAKKLDAVVVSADGGNKNFYSTTAPTKDMKPGDLWFDGSKGNLPHRWDGSKWVSVADERVQAVQKAQEDLKKDLSTVKATADGKNQSFYQPKEPTGSFSKGDLWFDTSAGGKNRVSVWDGKAWVDASDKRVQAVQKAQEDLKKDLTAVKATADGKNQSYYQPKEPTGTFVKGDLWFDTSASGKSRVSVWDGKTWVDASDKRVQDVQKAQEALAGDLAGVRKSVDGKTSIRWEPKAPTSSTPGGATGDTWHQYTGGAHVGTWRWDGKTWVQQSLDPVMIPKLDIGTGTFGELDGARLKVGTVGADKVLVGSDRNLIPDGDLTRGGAGWPDSLTFDPDDKPSPDLAGSMVTREGQGSTNFRGPVDYPVEPGDELVFECWLKADKPDSVFYVEVRSTGDSSHVGGWSGNATSASTYPVARYTVPTKWTKVTATSTVGDGVPAVYFNYFYFNHSSGSETNAVVKLAGLKLYRKVGTTIIANGAITTDKIATGAITADSGVVASLDAGKITSGFIDSARIQAGSIRADQIQVSTDDNWLSIPMLANGITTPHRPLSGGEIKAWNRDHSYGPSFMVKRGTSISSAALRAPEGSSGSVLDGSMFPVQAGMRLMFRARLYLGGSYTDNVVPAARTRAYHYKPDGSYLSTDVFGEWVTPKVYSGVSDRIIQHEWVVPDGAGWMQLYIQLDGDTGWVVFGDPVLKPMVSGTLIEPGAITTDKIAAGAITAESGVIGSLDLGKATVGELDGSRIKAGTLTVGQLLSGTPTNVLPGADNLAVSNAGWTGFGRNINDPSIWLQGRNTVENDGAFELSAGVTYTAATDVKSSVNGTMWFWQLMGQDGQGTPYIFSSETAGRSWRTATTQFTVPKSGRYKLKIWANHSSGASNADGYQWWRNPRISPAVDTTLIKDGSITTEKIATGAITAESGVIGSLDAGKITVGKLDGARIKANTVQADTVLVRGSVGSTVIADGAITTEKIATGAITAESGVIGSLDAGKITVGEMDGARIKANTVGTDLLKAGAVTAKILDATAIDGKTITGATVQTSRDHPKSLMDTAGFHVTDADGMDQITLGQAGGDLLSISDDEGTPVATVSNLGEISGAGLNIDTDPVFNGLPLVGQSQEVLAPTSAVELTSWFDALPRGLIAHGREDNQGGWEIKSGGGEMALMEVQADLKANRMYKITVSPIMVQNVGGGWVDMYVKYDWKGNRPTFGSTVMRKFSSTSWKENGVEQFGGSWMYSPGSDEDTRFLLTVVSNKRALIHEAGLGISELIIEDVGPFVDNVSVRRGDNNSVAAEKPTPPPPPPPPPPQKKNYTKKYWANGGRTFYTRGGWRNQNRDKCYQGTMPGMGGVQSIATFPSMTGDLSGATITAMTAYVYMEHFYYGSGGQVKLIGHNRLSSDITKIPDGWKLLKTSSRIGRNSGVQIPIPREYWTDFKTGKLKGIGLGDSSPSTSEYGYGPWKRMWIEVKYRK